MIILGIIIKMLTVNDQKMDWSVDFLINNPNFEFKHINYNTYKDTVVMFSTESWDNYAFRVMLYYIIKGRNLIETNYTTTSTHKHCIFYTRWCSGSLYEYTNKQYICTQCVHIWNEEKNNMKKLNDNLFEFKDDICYVHDNIFIQYKKDVRSIDCFDYFTLLQWHEPYTQHCDLHERFFKNKEGTKIIKNATKLNNEDYFNTFFIFEVCSGCLNYSLKLCVDINYKKYMLIWQFDLNDVRELINNDFINVLRSNNKQCEN